MHANIPDVFWATQYTPITALSNKNAFGLCLTDLSYST